MIWFRSYLNGLIVFPTFFNLSLNLAIRSSWSEPESAPGLVFAGVGSYSLFQGIFLTQGSNPGLLHCRQSLYHLSHQGFGSHQGSHTPIYLNSNHGPRSTQVLPQGSLLLTAFWITNTSPFPSWLPLKASVGILGTMALKTLLIMCC